MLGPPEMGAAWGRGRRECSVAWLHTGVHKGGGLGPLCAMEGYHFKKLVPPTSGDKTRVPYLDLY